VDEILAGLTGPASAGVGVSFALFGSSVGFDLILCLLVLFSVFFFPPHLY
jgi:hypothetical protein